MKKMDRFDFRNVECQVSEKFQLKMSQMMPERDLTSGGPVTLQAA